MKQLSYILQWRNEGDSPLAHDPNEETINTMVEEKMTMEEHGENLIKMFNNTAKPGERKRVFVGVLKSHGKGDVHHVWEKASLVTERGGYDRMRCRNCEATGKRHGLSQTVIIDTKFKKIALSCPNTKGQKADAVEEMEETEIDPIPKNQVELQEFTAKLWDEIFAEEKANKDKLTLYNTAALRYNKAAGKEIIKVIRNFNLQKQENMATAKKAAKKAAPKKAAPKKAAPKKAAPKKAAAKKSATKKAAGDKPLGKGAQIQAFLEKGLSVNEIVEKGFHKPSVAWYASKGGYTKK